MTKRHKPTYKRHPATGWVLPRDGFEWEDFEAACRYPLSPKDIVLMTYPKSGTTWLQHMLYLLVRDMVPIPEGHRLDSYAPYLEKSGLSLLRRLDLSPQPISTHLSFSCIAVEQVAALCTGAPQP
ncbi:hypothetical protein HPB47_015978 [Ixodes persulcatus]|uniref:Uncharacterized protein n=1 Tax=Ixodes persulcatus TaxID=34615 RepID=A0AC60QS11_IXOPE|nr:hypothetical protein HPB47_015978 [Ixodes persulcatus]